MLDKQRQVLFGFALGLLLALGACGDPPRQALGFEALTRRPDSIRGPLPNVVFMPAADAGRARHAFEGALILSSAEMRTSPEKFTARTVLGRDTKLFPGVSLSFFTYEDHLVPVNRNLIRVGSLEPGGTFWDILVSPGQIWSEPDDEGWSRASFPFALANALEGESHNGVATFLFRDNEVSGVRYQIVTQTTPYYVADFFAAWGQLEARFEATPIENLETLKSEYEEELANRFPVATWSELEALVGPEMLEGFDGPINPENIILLGLIYNGTLYRTACRTPYGDLPYCDVSRFGIWSVTKTAAASVAMLRLAEKYGVEVFQLRILDYLDVDPPHDGWDEVTFGDALNMATGIGEGSETIDPNNPSDGYLVRYEEWYDVESAGEKITAILAGSNHPWGPGEVMRYRDQDIFLLGAAMDGFLKGQEGPDADLWEFIQREIYRPIGIQHAPANLTLEPDGSDGLPQIAGGYYPTLEDLARIARLIQNRGAHEGRQILHGGKLAEMMYQTPIRGLTFGSSGGPTHGSYHMAVWHRAFVAGPDCRVELSYMSGWGGHKVLLLPNGLTALRIARADAGDQAAGDLSGMARAAHRLKPLCD
ncbi:MAG: serine hydrolase domain-containing protein [Acidobacteriota bacterium]